MKTEVIYNEDCQETMDRIAEESVDVILTSPPYNTGRPSTSDWSRDNYECRYDVYLDTKTSAEFINWCCDLFNKFNKVLKENGVVLWNMSYGNDDTVTHSNNDLLWLLIGKIIENTPFTVADHIVWRKMGGVLPNNVSKNKLTRVCESVFVFVRKDEYSSFHVNKKEAAISASGQQFYSPIYNYIEAKNNDEVCPINKATYSSELCEKLIRIYAPLDENTVVYDPFMGTGTTAVACRALGIGYIGSEISQAQCEWAEKRLNNVQLEMCI